MSFSALDPSHALALRERPIGRAAMTQEWRNLTFAHYAVDPALMLPHLPPGLVPDVFPDHTGELKAWVGFVPFEIRDLRYPGSRVSLSFLETNLRTYVRLENVPGVWFFSLDATSRLAVAGARIGYGLPYWRARLSSSENGDRRSYQGIRTNRSKAEYSVEETIGSQIAEAVPGSLEFFLVERYLLFSRYLGKLYVGRVHHRPYRLHSIESCMLSETISAVTGLPQEAFSHFLWSPGVEVEVFPLTRAS